MDQPVQMTPPPDGMDIVESNLCVVLNNRIDNLERQNKILMHSLDEIKVYMMKCIIVKLHTFHFLSNILKRLPDVAVM